MNILVTGGAGYVGRMRRACCKPPDTTSGSTTTSAAGTRRPRLPGRLIEGEVGDRANAATR